jgi:hypothetical protein
MTSIRPRTPTKMAAMIQEAIKAALAVAALSTCQPLGRETRNAAGSAGIMNAAAVVYRCCGKARATLRVTSRRSPRLASAPCCSINRARLSRPRRSHREQATSSMVSLAAISANVNAPRLLIPSRAEGF